MKKIIKVFIVLLVVILFAIIGVKGFQIYKESQKTPAEILEIEKQKTELAYKTNLEQALSLKDAYEFVVVLNPAHGGTDKGYENLYATEKDVVLAVCNKVVENNRDASVGIFITRPEDVGMDESMRLSFMEQVQPDFFIDVHVSKNATAGTYGTSVSYDTTYYNRKLTNTEFADIMEKSVVSAIRGYAAGIEDVTGKTEFSILQGLTIPAVSISCGDLQGEKEGILLGRENYQNNIALGMLEGIYLAKKQMQE